MCGTELACGCTRCAVLSCLVCGTGRAHGCARCAALGKRVPAREVGHSGRGWVRAKSGVLSSRVGSSGSQPRCLRAPCPTRVRAPTALRAPYALSGTEKSCAIVLRAVRY
eukprot:3938857-Rhodomonas_salina.2